MQTKVEGPAVPPPALRPGDCLQVVAPSGVFEEDAFERGISRLRRRYQVRYDDGITERQGYLAGADRRRLGELVDALQDKKVKALVAVRGGYGATRLLGRLDISLLSRHRKLLVGFSDITALHAAWARAGVRSLHATMAAGLGDCEQGVFDRWVGALEGTISAPLTGLTTISGGRARGVLTGGNLSILSALIGTGFGPPLQDRVLFLEDTAERPYRIDRMLTTWLQAGWLAKASAIVLGAFSKIEPAPDGVTVQQVLRERLGTLGIPVVCGVPSGHLDDNLELPLGAEVSVDADAGVLRFHQSAVQP